MTVLYPRLKSESTDPIIDRLEYHLRHGTVEFSDSELEEAWASPKAFPGTGGSKISLDALTEIRSDCLEAVSRAEDDETAGGFARRFDYEVGKSVYTRTLGSRGEMGNAEVWNFFALILLPDLAVRRFPLSGGGLQRDRFRGGNRRHVFQRLWKRWQAIGEDLLTHGDLKEDEFVALLERRVTMENSDVARAVAERILDSGLNGDARRQYARSLARGLVQATGITAVGGDAQHLSALLSYLDSRVRSPEH